MKRIFASLVILQLFFAALSIDVQAKAPYCGVALQRCTNQCRDVFGEWNPLTGGCELGCAIGYLAC